MITLSGQISDYKNIYLSGNIKKDVMLFKDIFKKDSVLRTKEIKVRNQNRLDCFLIYMDGMVDSEQVNDAVIEPLLTNAAENDCKTIADYIATQVLFVRDAKTTDNVAQILSGILYGEALLLIDGSKTAVLIDLKGFKTRGISAPEQERVLQGPREAFEEAAMFNLAMIRRRLKTPDLCTEMINVGRRTETMVFVCYLDSLADKQTVERIKQKIKKIDIDGILDSNYISEIIKEKRYSVFKTAGSTERPDIVAARLLEGRIAIVVDGTPMVLTLPYLFSENFQSDEDYYINFWVSSLGRILRFFCFFMSISIPAVFIALTTFHTELLPTALAVATEKLRAGVPFSPFTECLIMLFVFEILREAGIRMPQNLGPALSIVGGLVVGQAAVDARIISTPILIIVAISAISGLMIQRLKGAVFYLRIIFLCISAFFGFYGYILAISAVIMHIISLTSFGVDYTASLRSFNSQNLKDTVIRAPWFAMRKRPVFNKNKTRQKG